MAHVGASGSRGLQALCALLMGTACASVPKAEVVSVHGNYANASVLGCEVKGCEATVLIKSTCASGPLTVAIWRDVTVRGAALFRGGLGDQTFANGRKTVAIPVCAPAVKSVQTLAFQIDGACVDHTDKVTAQFSCSR